MKLRKLAEPLIGPLAAWELVRLARRGQVHRVRQLVLYLLFFALSLTPIAWFTHTEVSSLFSGKNLILSIPDVGEFGSVFTLCVLEAVLLGVVVMMPGYAALAVAEEKERDTLQMLLTTPLSDRELVLGKSTGRLGFVLAGAAAALPLLCAVNLYGSIDDNLLIVGGFLTFSTATLCTAIGVEAACATAGIRPAFIRAYAVTALAVFGVIVNPFLILYWSVDAGIPWLTRTGFSIAYALLQLTAAAFFFQSAIRGIRNSGSDFSLAAAPRQPVQASGSGQIPTPKPAEESADGESQRLNDADAEADWGPFDRPLDALSPGSIPIEMRVFRPPLPPVMESNPLLWKERYVSGRDTGTSPDGRPLALSWLIIMAALGLIILGAGILISDAISGTKSIDYGGHLLLVGGTLAGGVYLVPCAIGLAAAIARERHRKTIDNLFSLPLDRRSILRIKIRAVLERGWLLAPIEVAGIWSAFGIESRLAARGRGRFLCDRGNDSHRRTRHAAVDSLSLGSASIALSAARRRDGSRCAGRDLERRKCDRASLDALGIAW